MRISINNMLCECKEVLLPWQKLGLSYTANGYGRKIPTCYKVKYGGRWYRIYTCIYSNAGTSYIIVNNKWVITGDNFTC